MCRTVGYGVPVSLPPDCKNNITLRHRNPHPTVYLISNTNSGKPSLCIWPLFHSFSCRHGRSWQLSTRLSSIGHYSLFSFRYRKVCTGLIRKWESPVSYSANKPALFIYKRKVDLLSQLIGN